MAVDDASPTAAPVTGPATAGLGRHLASAAALIAGLTLLSRLAGFVRTMMLGWAAGDTDTAAMYQTANTIPNIIFEIVAGGALAALVVPLIAGPLARRDTAQVARLGSALLTWALATLVPLALLLAVFARPIIELTNHQATADAIDDGARMLRIFAPQLPLYGIGIVLTGVLQAHRRFAWPVLAPLLSSLVVIGTYLTFGVVDGRGRPLAQVSAGGVLILSVGTTLGVVALSLCLLIPLRRMGLRLRPTFTFGHADAASQVRRLAGAAVVTVLAQQLTLLLVLTLANDGPTGAYALYGYTQTLFLLPWAIFAVPVATSAYPELTESAATGAHDHFRRVLAQSARVIVLLSLLGTAALVALAKPLAVLMNGFFAGSPPVSTMAAAVVAFAPGLVGYGLYALLSRALYARGDAKIATIATVAGFGAAAAAAIVLSQTVARADRVVALAAANSIGMTILAAVALAVTARRVGPEAFVRLGRTGAIAFLAAVLAGAAGFAIAAQTTPSTAGAVVWGMMSGVAVAVVYLSVAGLLDPHDVRPLLARLSRRVARLGHRPATHEPEV